MASSRFDLLKSNYTLHFLEKLANLFMPNRNVRSGSLPALPAGRQAAGRLSFKAGPLEPGRAACRHAGDPIRGPIRRDLNLDKSGWESQDNPMEGKEASLKRRSPSRSEEVAMKADLKEWLQVAGLLTALL